MLLALQMNNLFGSAGPPQFVGPSISNLTLQQNSPMTPLNFSGRFFDAQTLTYTVVGTLPTGLSLSSAGVLSGTPTVLQTQNVAIRATDTDTNTQDSNTFSITISATASADGDMGGANVGSNDVGERDVGSPRVDTPPNWVN